MKKSKRILRTVVLIIVSLAFLSASIAKLIATPMEVALFTNLNLENFRVAIGIIELVIVVCLWWRPLRGLGILLGTSVLSAAIAETFSLGAYNQVFFPAMMLLLVWVLAKLNRHGCHWCREDGHCHCTCAQCKDCTAMQTKGLCNCKPDCTCVKGSCTC